MANLQNGMGWVYITKSLFLKISNSSFEIIPFSNKVECFNNLETLAN